MSGLGAVGGFGRVLAAGVVLACGLSGCGAPTAAGSVTEGAVTEQDCVWMGQLPAGDGPAVTVVTDPTADAPAVHLPEPVTTALAEAAAQNGRVTLVAVDGGAAQVLLQDVALSDPTAGDGRRRRLAALAAACVDRAALTATAGEPGSDVLAAVQAAARLTPAGGQVHVVGNGLATAGLLDLTGLPAGHVAAVQVAGAVPAAELPSLPGRTVTFYGVGETSGSAPLTQSARGWLAELWVALCERGGAAACTVSSVTGRPSDTPRPTGHTDPVVAWPEVTVRVSAAGEEHSLPAALLFAVDAATLTRDADAALAPVVTRLRQDPALRATVTGHTDSDCPTAEYCQLLAERRAATVVARLSALGVDPARLTARGAGHTQPAAADRTSTGALNPVAAAANRRVTINLS